MVVIEIDWTTQVTTVPSVVAMRRFLVTARIIRRRVFPATACIPPDVFLMPGREVPPPPTRVRTELESAVASMQYPVDHWVGGVGVEFGLLRID
jgi:hypothetical protein